MTLPARVTDTELGELPLDAGLDALLAELLAEADDEPARRLRWPLVVAAAASVVVVAAVPAYVATRDEPPAPAPAPGDAVPSQPASTATDRPTTTRTPAPAPEPVTSTWRGRERYAVLDAPGWVPYSVHSEPPAGLSVAYSSGGRELTVQWEPERWYAGRLAEARGQSTSTIEMLGEDATYVAMQSQQQFAFLPVVEGYGLYVNASFTTEAEFADLVASLRYVDAAGLQRTLPQDVVPPDRAVAVTTAMLADATLPPGYVADVGGWNSPGSVAGQLVRPVGCAWARAYVEARSSDDAAGRQSAVDALAGSRHWTLLAEADNRTAYAYLRRLIRDGAPDIALLGSSCDAEADSPAYRDYLVSQNPGLAEMFPPRG